MDRLYLRRSALYRFLLTVWIMLGGFFGMRVGNNTIYAADAALLVAAATLLVHWLRRRCPISHDITSLFLGYWVLSLVVGVLFIPPEFATLGLKEHVNGLRASIAAVWAVHLVWSCREHEREWGLRFAFWTSLAFLPAARALAGQTGTLALAAVDNSLVFLLPILAYGIQEVVTTRRGNRIVGMSRLSAAVAVALASAGMAFVYTRSAVLGGLVGAASIMALKSLGGRRAGAALVATVLATSSLGVVAFATFNLAGEAGAVRRIRGIVDSGAVGYGNDGRFAIWADALRILAQPWHLIGGVGAHNYVFHSTVEEIKDGVVVDPALKSSTIKQGHNQFLTFAAELGLLGLALFGCMLGVAIYRATLHKRSMLLLGLVLAFTVMNVTGDFIFARAPYLLQVSVLWWYIHSWCLLPQMKTANVAKLTGGSHG